MSNFYNYDTRGASLSNQIIHLERMLEVKEQELEMWQERAYKAEDEASRLRALVKKLMSI